MGRPHGADFSLKGLMSQSKIEIPEYQRTYDWSKSTVEQLLNCLTEHQKLFKGTLQNNPYFLGNLMIHANVGDHGGKWYLVDGQQRLVTLTILAGLIRDMLCDCGEYNKAFELQSDIIGDLQAESPHLSPRDTLSESSPKELLWPIQAPMDQVIEFQFAEEYTESKSMSQFNLESPIVAKFPLKANSVFELNIGVKFIVIAEISAGQEVNNLYGNLILDPGASVQPSDRMKLSSTWRSTVINEKMRHTWSRSRLIPQHFYKNMRNFIISEMEESQQTNDEFLTDWKDMVTYMSFTTTTFEDDSDAIYYFGKLNDADTSQQLNVGDLMRHHAAYVVKRPPIDHPRDSEIKLDWNSVEMELKEEKPKDMVPAFLSSWLTAQGNRQTERKAYSELKKQSKEKFETTGTWNKEEFFTWIRDISKGAKRFREIVFPEIGDGNHLSMKCIEGLAKQHRPLFLAGLLAFENHGLSDEMRRLINIFEFMTIKGVELPTLCGANGITSQERYSFVDKYCAEMYTKSRAFNVQMRPEEARSILDNFASEIKTRCNSIWLGAAADPALPDVTGWDVASLSNLDFNQNLARLILSRIEIVRSGHTKTWDVNVEVEHIGPQTWQDDWADITKGGGFSDIEDLEQCVNKIGNRTLLNPGSNSSLGNISFNEKQTHDDYGYNRQAESWFLTKDLHSDETGSWSAIKIQERSERLINEFIGIYADEFMFV